MLPKILLLIILVELSYVSCRRRALKEGARMSIVQLENEGLTKLNPSFYPKSRENNIKYPPIPFNLSLSFKQKIIKTLYPKDLIRFICRLFSHNRYRIPTNTVMLVYDDWILSPTNFNKVADYFVNLLSSLGIPSITWMPVRVGQFELSKESLAIRLEPTNWHIVYAIVDFMKAYNWTKAALVMTNSVLDYHIFRKEFYKMQRERDMIMDSSHFKFTISQTFTLQGIDLTDIKECKRIKCKFIHNAIRVLEKLYRNDDRVIIFHGLNYELIQILHAVKVHLVGPKRYLRKLFAKGYIWICTPVLNAIVKTGDRTQKENPDLIVLTGLWNLKSIDISNPGMFFFSSWNHYLEFSKKHKIARLLWLKSLAKLTKILMKRTKRNETEVKKMLVPSQLCRKNLEKWKYGSLLFKIMRTMTLNISGEYIGFNNNGVINTTEMFIFNSKVKDKIMSWHKVGSWSISSKWGKEKSKLRIDGVTWPGNAIKPPKGRPDKFKLKVVTFQEIPFVISQESETGSCDANSIKCWICKKPRGYIPSTYLSQPDREPPVDSATNLKMIGLNISSHFPYVNGCCSGLSMDMLSELQKDLDFEVDLFEVPDGHWGGWTPNGWNGLVKVLKDKKADMAITSFKITPNRSEQVDFSVPFQETGIAIIVALREGAISPTAFLKPYDYQSWFVILVFSVHASGAALFIYEWLSPHGLDRGNQVDPEHKFSFFRSLWLIWSMLFGAAVNADNPRGTASRFLANIWALFALVFLASYTANLAAFMIAKDDFYNLAGIKDPHLMYPETYKPTFTFATVPSGATEENIIINFPKMYKHMMKYKKSSVEEGIKALKSGEINAFIYDSNVLEYRAAKDEKCKLKTVGNLFAMTGYGVGFPKNSKWLSKINDRILEYQSNGKMRRWKKFWLTGACKKDRRLDSTNKKLGVKNFISAFILLLGGIILCSVLLFLEHTFYRYLRPHLTNIDKYGCCGLVSISMGQILTFEQSVNQTVDLMKHHKCSNTICQSRQSKNETETNQMKERIKTLERFLIDERLEKQHLKRLLQETQGNGAKHHKDKVPNKKINNSEKNRKKQFKHNHNSSKSTIPVCSQETPKPTHLSFHTSCDNAPNNDNINKTIISDKPELTDDESSVVTPTFVYTCHHQPASQKQHKPYPPPKRYESAPINSTKPSKPVHMSPEAKKRNKQIRNPHTHQKPLMETADSVDPIHLANLSPSQVYRPNSQTYTGKSITTIHDKAMINRVPLNPANTTSSSSSSMALPAPAATSSKLLANATTTNNHKSPLTAEQVKKQGILMEKESCL